MRENRLHGSEGEESLEGLFSTPIVPWPVLSVVVRDGKLKSIHGAWIPAIHAGMTLFENSDHVI